MIHDLKPYPEYKDSGVPWLGEVPEHWDVRRLKTVARVVMGQSPASQDCNVTGVGRPFLQGCAEFGQDHPVPKQYCPVAPKSAPRGSLLLSVRAPVGRTNIADQEYGIGRGLCAVVPGPLLISTEMARYLVEVTNAQLFSVSTGSTYDAVSAWQVGGTFVPVATPAEQSAIVRLLYHADRRIRRYIRAKKKLIALLNEQKQAIIHCAVTRGLDPNVRLRPSGVEWLGNVPEHWEVRPARYFYREVDERSSTGAEELLSVSHITGVTPRSQKSITMFMASSYEGHKLCRCGDLVINTMWAWMAALGVAKQAGIVSPSYGVYRPVPNSKLLGDYADLLLRTRPYVSEYMCRSTGIRSSRLRLYPEQFLRIKLVCPSAEEQQAILDCVAAETAATERAMGSTQREIDLLREYRTRLIADVVTGKLDVREAAARLPEEAEAPEPLDEADALTDADENAANADLDAAPGEAEAE